MAGLLAIGLPLYLSLGADRTIEGYLRTSQVSHFVILIGVFGVTIYLRHSISRVLQVVVLLVYGLWNQVQGALGSLSGLMVMGIGIILAAHYGYFHVRAAAKISLVALAMVLSILLQVFLWAVSEPHRPPVLDFAYTAVAVLGLLAGYSLVVRDAAMSAAHRRAELERELGIRTEEYRNEVRSRQDAEEAAEVSAEESRKLAAERLALLQEVQHRAKNSIQMTLALLESGDPRSPSDSTINRVRAIGLVYDLVDASEDLSSIQLEQYIERLVWYLQLSYDNHLVGITYEPDGNCTRSQLDATINLGLLIHEIVQIVVSCSFADAGGTITIAQKTDLDAIELLISHGGQPLPAGIESDTTDCGTGLLSAFLQRLHIRSAIVCGPPNEWRLTIPAEAIVKPVQEVWRLSRRRAVSS
jgi:two-component sensor histidine kinase